MSAAGFALWDAADERDAGAWTELWEAWPAREVFAHPAYVRLYAAPSARPLCAAWRSDEGSVLYPLLLRDVPGGGTDTTTPYGYGGAFFWGGERAALAGSFWPAFDEWAAGAGVISEFVRLALFEDELLPYPGEREVRLANAVRDLEPAPEELWMDVEHKVRKNVKKAQRSGLSFELDRGGGRLGEFLALYERTMRRRGARADYFFPPAFFERIRAELGGLHAFVHVLHEGRVVSTELVLVSAESVYSFLGGTDERAFALRPNDLLKWETILWARGEGKRRYVLGGGLEPDDGVFRHKLSFAPGGKVPFRVGRRVLRPDAYERLVRARAEAGGWEPRPGYFPLYRA